MFLCQQAKQVDSTYQVQILNLQTVMVKKHLQQILQHVPLRSTSPILSEDRASNKLFFASGI